MRSFNPAASYDFGTFLWGMGEHVTDAALEHYAPAAKAHLDYDTASFAHAKIDAEYDADIERQIEAHFASLEG